MAKVVQDKCLGHCCKHQRDSYYRITESLQLKCRKKIQKGLEANSDAKGKCNGQGTAWAPGPSSGWIAARDHPSGAGFGKAASATLCSSSCWAGRAVQFMQHRPALTQTSNNHWHPGLTHTHPHHPCPLLPASWLACNPACLCCQNPAPRKMSVFTTERAA